ncbi:MAG: RdgB/HAM1 family non-canonical purine NTP pyrophosphatase [Muribaculaceae bacterium]|nr:RdgB/HAM1 family non-canonical purine NTP pyrophosphatase [Muribaculaceae bacterium]
MRKIVFATNNAHKLEELRRICGEGFEILSLRDIGCTDDIPEDAPTFEGNALAKASWVKSRYGYDCLADDSGLEVDALDGAPGVHSARFAGEGHDDGANNRLLLEKLSGVAPEKRTARFRTAICLLEGDSAPRYFSGKVEGHILEAPRGNGGFGYDPLFVPIGFDKTFAEIPGEEKDAVSHRGRAVRALLDYLLH